MRAELLWFRMAGRREKMSGRRERERVCWAPRSLQLCSAVCSALFSLCVSPTTTPIIIVSLRTAQTAWHQIFSSLLLCLRYDYVKESVSEPLLLCFQEKLLKFHILRGPPPHHFFPPKKTHGLRFPEKVCIFHLELAKLLFWRITLKNKRGKRRKKYRKIRRTEPFSPIEQQHRFSLSLSLSWIRTARPFVSS